MIVESYHRAVLVQLLRTKEFASLTADEAFARIDSDKNLCGLRLKQFVTADKFKRTHPSKRTHLIVVVAGPGLPGFPNRLKREDFDAAWREAHS